MRDGGDDSSIIPALDFFDHSRIPEVLACLIKSISERIGDIKVLQLRWEVHCC
jgi:hypothetical protein